MWYPPGNYMGSTWKPHGVNMKTTWFLHGTWTPCGLIVHMWTQCGYHIDTTWFSQWIPPGFHVDTMWFPCAQHVVSSVDNMVDSNVEHYMISM